MSVICGRRNADRFRVELSWTGVADDLAAIIARPAELSSKQGWVAQPEFPITAIAIMSCQGSVQGEFSQADQQCPSSRVP